MKSFVRALCVLGSLGLLAVLIAVPALAGVRPSVTALSTHRGTYWGGSTVTVYGHNFTHVQKVMFGSSRGDSVHVRSSTKLTVQTPVHGYGSTNVRVVTSSGWSSKASANKFTFTHPSMNSRIQGGLTARQEQSISARVRRAHHGVYSARRSSRWTSAMGSTALMRARSWLGLPYSWAGGNAGGPTTGVCAHNGGDFDCHIVGFDCSGLTLYAWAPYERLAHYAATQRSQAGRFHPTIGQLVPGDLVFFSAYIANGIGHTAIYEGNGNVIQAEQSGSQVMRSRLSDVIAFSGTYRGATRPMSTGKQAAGPRLHSITSKVAAKGGYVTVNGSQLSTATSVVVGGKMLYSFAKRTSTQLVVRVPAHKAGRVSVAVSNPWGTANSALAYVNAPKVSSLSPARGPAAGGSVVTVTGTDLSTVSRVTVGGRPVSFHVLAANRLTVTMPAHAPGAAALTLSSPFGISNTKSYTYLAAPPRSSAPPSTGTAPSTSTAPSTGTAPSTSTAPPSTDTPSDPSTSSSSVRPPGNSSTDPSSGSSDAPSGSSATNSSSGAGVPRS